MDLSKVNFRTFEERRHSFNKVILWTLRSSSLHFDVLKGDKHKIQSSIKENVNLNNLDRWNRTPLFYAVLKNLQDIVEIFLKADVKIDIKDFSGRTVLHYCAEKGYYGCLKAILLAIEKQKLFFKENFVDNYAHDINGVTPFHLATSISSVKCIQLLMKYNCSLFTGSCDSVDYFKRTPLHWAAAYGCDESVALLLKQGSNSLLPDSNGKLAIHYSALSSIKSSKSCLPLLAHANNVNNQDFYGATPLHLAVASQMLEKVTYFNKCKKLFIDINAYDKHGRTPLHLACARGLDTIVKLLLSSGADINIKDLDGNTALHYAVLHNHKKVTRIIVENLSSLDCSNDKGESAMHWAAAIAANASLLIMCQHGGFAEKYDGNGATPLHIAAMNNHTSSVEIFLKLKVPIDITTTDGCTPLHYAAKGGSVKVVKYLLAAGAFLNKLDKYCRNSLHYSVIGGYLHLSQLLIESGISIECKDIYGQTPLHFAAFFDYSDLLCLLLENRANINASDNQGKVGLHIACEQQNYGTVKCLLEFFAYPNYIDNTKNRETPLDICLRLKRLDIASLLVDSGGVQSNLIFNYAASIIQVWWKNYCTRKNLAFSSLLGQKELLLADNAALDIASAHFQATCKQITGNSTFLKAISQQITENLIPHSKIFQREVESDENFDCEGSSNSVEQTYDEIDLNSLPQYPIHVTEKEDGSIVRELNFNGFPIALPSDEKQEQFRKALAELEIVEISSCDDEEY